jgi:hypothetical protein
MNSAIKLRANPSSLWFYPSRRDFRFFNGNRCTYGAALFEPLVTDPVRNTGEKGDQGIGHGRITKDHDIRGGDDLSLPVAVAFLFLLYLREVQFSEEGPSTYFTDHVHSKFAPRGLLTPFNNVDLKINGVAA